MKPSEQIKSNRSSNKDENEVKEMSFRPKKDKLSEKE